MIFTKYGRCILIDWQKPLECKIWAWEGDFMAGDYNHDWLPVVKIQKNNDGTYSVWDEPETSMHWGEVHEDGRVMDAGRQLGLVRNKKGFDLKGLEIKLEEK